MTIQQTIYFMSLAGALAGLISWAVGVWIPIVLTISQEDYWLAEATDSVLIGILMSGLCIYFSDRWSERGVKIGRVLGCASLGFVAGLLSSLSQRPLRSYWLGEQSTWQNITLAWLITGAYISAAIGIFRYRTRKWRVLLSIIGGAAGGAVGGAVLVLLGESLPYITHAFGLVLTGCGISLGSTGAVTILTNGVIKYLYSDDPKVVRRLNGKQQEWELLRNDRRLFGRALNSRNRGRYLHIPDSNISDQHAIIYEFNGKFYLNSTDENRDAAGKFIYPLCVKRNENGGGVELIEAFDEELQIEDGDEIRMGQTWFQFSIPRRGHGKGPARALSLISMLWILSLTPTLIAQSLQNFKGAQISQADKIRLLECVEGSERPCFRATVNIVDRLGQPLNVSMLHPQKVIEQLQVFDGDLKLKVFYVGFGQKGDKPPQRYAILLVDVSGSMLEAVSADPKDKRTKFDVMKQACMSFADDFAEGIDHVAIIPFESRWVAESIKRAEFLTTKAHLKQRISDLTLPRKNGNTALFTASLEVIKVMQAVSEKASLDGISPQCLIMVMTDGKNSVGNKDDDPNLLNDWRPVKEMSNRAQIQLIAVGFGNSSNIDEPVLRSLAWPSSAQYLSAQKPSELVQAFQTARSLQVERMQIAFLPEQRLRTQLIKDHQFKIQMKLGPETTVEGSFLWGPATFLVPPPFDGVLTKQEQDALPFPNESRYSWIWLYLIVLGFLASLLHFLWNKYPKQIWADQYDSHTLRHRALTFRHNGRRP